MKNAMTMMALTAAAIAAAAPLERVGYTRVDQTFPRQRRGHSGVARMKRQAKKARRR